MIKRYRILSALLVLLLVMTILFTGCEDTDNEPVNNYDFSVFLGSLDEPIEIDAILTEYGKSTGLSIEPITIPENKDNKSTLKNLLEGENSPAVFAVANDIDEKWLVEDGYIKESDESVPYLMNGYGYSFDRAMIGEMFGSKTDQLIKDLRACTYEEWTVFVTALDDFIKDRSPQTFSIQNNSYKFPSEKGENTKNLNGVFAFPGANSDIYGYTLMDIVAQTADLDEWESEGTKSSQAAINVMNPTLNTYIGSLDFITTHLSGKYSSGIRGSDFANEDYYSNYLANDMFMSGKGVFALIGSTKYSELQTLNAKKAETLEFMPVKMPYDKSLGDKTTKGAILNSSIPAEVSYSLFVNRSLPKEDQENGQKFLEWFAKHEAQWSDPLSTSIKTYVNEGNTLEYDFEPTELRKWEKVIFADDGVSTYLRKELWTDEVKNEMKLYMSEQWYEK